MRINLVILLQVLEGQGAGGRAGGSLVAVVALVVAAAVVVLRVEHAVGVVTVGRLLVEAVVAATRVVQVCVGHRHCGQAQQRKLQHLRLRQFGVFLLLLSRHENAALNKYLDSQKNIARP